MIQPVRIQRRRTKGYNMQAESIKVNGLPCVSCTRPGRWSNPYKVGDVDEFGNVLTIETALNAFKIYTLAVRTITPDFYEPLRNKNLSCFCPLDQKCHTDFLLKIANS